MKRGFDKIIIIYNYDCIKSSLHIKYHSIIYIIDYMTSPQCSHEFNTYTKMKIESHKLVPESRPVGGKRPQEIATTCKRG